MLTGEAKKAYQRELMRKRRAEKAKSDLGLKEPVSETDLGGSDVAKREVVLVERRCELCNRTWSSSVEMQCPYCHGKIKKVIPG
jgi:Zn finger protein HypA/HybF involved in hydrogenase expression